MVGKGNSERVAPVSCSEVMLNRSLIMLLMAILAAALGFGVWSGVAAVIAKIFFVLFLVLFAVALFFDARRIG